MLKCIFKPFKPTKLDFKHDFFFQIFSLIKASAKNTENVLSSKHFFLLSKYANDIEKKVLKHLKYKKHSFFYAKYIKT